MGRRKKNDGVTRTIISVIQDKSGSMSSRVDATISGYNEYIQTLKKEAEGEVLLTLTQFDTRFDIVYNAKPLKEVSNLHRGTYIIGGMTALYDAVGKTVKDIEKAKRKDDKVLVVIMTDGGENSSREWNHQKILDLLKDKRKDGWEFIFLGAGEEAWNTGQSLGFDSTTSINYGTIDVRDHIASYNVMASASAGVTKGRSSRSFLSTSPKKIALEDKAKKEVAHSK
jgi:uncharacterized protein YegL